MGETPRNKKWSRAMTTEVYHYAESGLDNVYLVGGFEFVDGPGERRVKIKDIDGLHEAIGRLLITEKKNLSGKEIRFLRQEMLMSQAVLAKLLEIAEQTVLRWEKGKTDIPKPAETLIRLLYREHIKDKGAGSIRSKLERLSDLEDKIDGRLLRLRQSSKGWQPEIPQQAA
jgi:DNA-binding transcriptional regulator YiaG